MTPDEVKTNSSAGPKIGIGRPAGPGVEMPGFLEAVSEVALSSDGGPVAIILPEARQTAVVVATLCARSLAPDHIRSSDEVLAQLAPGDRVRIIPDGGVYEFDSVEPSGYWLRPLQVSQQRTASRFWTPVREAWRIEPTARKRPLGQSSRTSWSAHSPTVWDAFCGMATGGNAALNSLAVVFIGARSEFEDTLLSTGFSGTVGQPTIDVSTGLVRGFVDEDGHVEIDHPEGTSGEPLIAVARNHAAALKLAQQRSPGSLTFISTRHADAATDRSAAEMIAARHRFILIAPSRARDEVAALRSHDWTVVELGGPSGLAGGGTGIPAIDRSCDASRWMLRSPAVLAQPSPDLVAAFAALDRLGQEAGEHAIDDEDVSSCVNTLRALFFEASDWLDAPDSAVVETLMEAFRDLGKLHSRVRSVVGPAAVEAAESCRAALDRFTGVVARRAMTPKGECLLQLAEASQKGVSYRQAIVVGHGRTAQAVSGFLDRLGAPMACLTPAALGQMGGFDRVNVLSMMRREAFSRLVDPWPAPDVMFLGYQHEIDLYRQRLATRQRLVTRLSPDAATINRFPSLAPFRALEPASQPLPGPEPAPEPVTLSRPARRPPAAASGEASRPARYCRFAGHSWMAIMEERTVARVQVSATGRMQITAAPGRELQDGDLILVREDGARDVVRDMAEALVGVETYGLQRKQAALWSDMLRQSGKSPEALRVLLRHHGLSRGLAAIRYWLSDEGPIGPSEEEVSIPAIAEALGHDPTSPRWRNCITAIQGVRGLHTQAGFRLTDSVRKECGGSLLEHSEYETPVRMSWGTVWLLEIDRIEPAPAAWPYTQVNRLRWESESWRQRLLAEVGASTDLDAIMKTILEELAD